MLDRLALLGVRRPRRVAVVALLAFLVAAAFGGPAAGILERDRAFEDGGAQAAQARKQLERATGTATEPGVLALVRDRPGGPAVARAAATLRADPAVARVDVPPAGRPSPLVARDGRSTVIAATLRADANRRDAVDRLEDALAGQRAVHLGGADVGFVQVNAQAAEDLAGGELLAFPVLAILAFLFFRGIAALLPLAVGAMTVLSTFALMRVANVAIDLSPFALNLVIGAGLGLAIDYSLFLVSRFREELGAGHDPPLAVRRTMATAGRTVVFSSLTVAAALACLCVFPLPFLFSMGIGGALVSLVAGATSLLVLPALFMLLGRRLGRVRPLPEGQGRWYATARAVMRRPGLFAVAAAVLMLLLAAPSLRTTWAGVDASILPESKSARVVDDAMRRDFPAVTTSPITVAVRAPADAGPRVAAYATALRGAKGVTAVAPPRSLGRDTWQIDVRAAGSAISDPALRTVEAVRAVPAPFPRAVGGEAASLHDQRAAVSRMLPLGIGLLLATTLSILWLMTGSVVLPIKALLMNLLTTAAATGMLVWIFQDGRLEGLLGYRSQGGIEQTDFLVMVAIVFGLSTDYGVFLLTRIKEARDARPPGPDRDRQAVAVGIQRTGGIVTAAALLLAVALGAFLTSKVVFLQEMGGGAAFAVLLDAFVVRTLLVPSLMALLGDWNWWSPGPLRRLHDRIGLDERMPEALAAATGPPATAATMPGWPATRS
ncbi:MMPL family transporter [Patulibacter defluvii]|uniref:MMPL family transporter n=1 Tax=Patulibacter defluvii TaxID=3095358 RepID=UPI002A74E3D7|nr:MMPL family transporter [Patulibacter sp. DM4]